jgi:DNA-binding PadR family transcriptional regulator
MLMVKMTDDELKNAILNVLRHSKLSIEDIIRAVGLCRFIYGDSDRVANALHTLMVAGFVISVGTSYTITPEGKKHMGFGE